MAGGTWKSQDKKQPGVYVNVQSDMKSKPVAGRRGTVAVCERLSWGPEGKLMAVRQGDDFAQYIGYANDKPQALFLREIFKGSDRTGPPVEVLLYRPKCKGAQKATAASDIIHASAKYPGVRGNDIRIAVMADPDESGSYVVQTIVDGAVAAMQSAKAVSDLVGNDWVDFGGEGALAATTGIPLTGGADGSVDAPAHAEFLTALEPCAFNVLIYDGDDATVQTAYAGFVSRLRRQIGRKCQAVMANAHLDFEGVISAANGVVLADGTRISANQATWWLGGAEAGANYNESLVYAQYPDAVGADPPLTSDQIDKALADGQVVFMREFGAVKVVSDLNTLITYTAEKNEAFAYNQVIRVIDTVANDIYKNFSLNVIGKVQNDDADRDLIKSWIVGYLNEIQANGGVKNFGADDVEVGAGEAINAVVITIAIQPVTAIEKIYVTVRLTDE